MMNLEFVLVLVLAGAASGAIEKRIVGGTSCGKDRQYHVQIESVQGGKTCGGSLISTRWVITASHCAEQAVKLKLGLKNDVAFWKKAWSFVKGSSKKYEQVIAKEKQFTYKDEEGKAHDIMLIKLNEDMSGSLPTIALPPVDCTKPEESKQVSVAGWGSKTADVMKAKAAKDLRCASTAISSCGENDKPGPSYFSDEETTMCAFKSGVEACLGDAGSAVEYNGQLYGIIVSEPVDKCANPIVMLNICHYRKWIDETIKNND